MLRPSGEPGAEYGIGYGVERGVPRPSRRVPVPPRRLRLLALACALAYVAVLPLTVASVGSSRDDGRGGPEAPARAGPHTGAGVQDDGRASFGSPGGPSAPTGSPEPSALAVGGGTAVRCGPELASPGGIEARTCVLIQGTETWARTSYRNATGDALTAVLSLMGPEGRAVRTHCAVVADDAPAMCETSREPAGDGPWAHTAVAEFAEAAEPGRGGSGPLLLRSDSNSPAKKGS